MAHPMAGQAKSSQAARLKRLTGRAGKAHGSSSMYLKTSYPSAGTQREYTISGKSGPKRADRAGKVGNFAAGGAVGKFALGGDTDKKKRPRKPAHTTNIIISHAGGRGGTGGGGGAGGRPVSAPVAAAPGGPPPMLPPRPPMMAGPPRPPMPPVGAAGPGPAGPPPVPVRPPVPPVGPPGLRPPGMAAGGAVKKAAKGGFLKDGAGKGYAGFPKAPTTDKGSKTSAYADGGPVKKRAFGGGGLGGPFGGGAPSPNDPTPQASGGLFQGPGLQREATKPIQGPPNVSQQMGAAQPARPAMPVTMPLGATASRMVRPAPGMTVGYSASGGTVARGANGRFMKGGAVPHDDEAQDRKLIKKMIGQEEKKEKGYAGGGFVPKNQDSADRALVGGKHHQQGVGYRDKGGTVGTPESKGMGPSMRASPANGIGRLAKTKAARSVPAKTEA